MLSDVRLLLEIQELDKEMIELNQQLAQYPQIWEEVKTEFGKKKAANDASITGRESHQKERRRVEQKLRMYSDDLRRNQAQQSGIKTAKEYEALNKQIDALKEKISSLEEQGVQLIDRDEEVEKKVVTSKEAYDKAHNLFKTEKERIRVQFNEKKARIAQLQKEREKLAKKSPPGVNELYDRLSKRHPGSVVVPVRTKSCSGCNFGLLPDALVQLHREERMATCTNCDRILSEDEDYAPEASAAG